MLSLSRIVLCALAVFVLAQAASYLVRTGALMPLVHAANPENPRRQLQISIERALSAREGATYLIGSRPFVTNTGNDCRLGENVVRITIDNPRWRDYTDTLRYLSRLKPHLIIFEAKPYMWMNIRYSWPAQNLDLLPTDVRPDILPLSDVRTFIGALAEAARPSGSSTPYLGEYRLIGLQYSKSTVDEELDRVTSALERMGDTARIIFALSENERLKTAMPSTQEAVLRTFSEESQHGRIDLRTPDAFVHMLGCRSQNEGAIMGED